MSTARQAGPWRWAGGLALAAAFYGCSRGAPQQIKPAKAVVSTDASVVARYVALPGVQSVRWIEEVPAPDAPRGAPGPHDLVLTAYAELDPAVWASLDAQLGGALGSRTEHMTEDYAEQILTPHALAQLPREGDGRRVEAKEYDITPLRRGPRFGDRGWRIGDGLLMSFTTH
ncbi:MAG: hypothetical protein ACRENE_27265 [Polyangiaceae bacterium]